jgi:hypothetical protein
MAAESRTNTVSWDYFVRHANHLLELVVSDARCLLWPLYFIRQALDPPILFATVTPPILSDHCTHAVGDGNSIQPCGGISIPIRLPAYRKVLGLFYSRIMY